MLKQALSLAAAGVFGCAGAPAPEPKTPEAARSPCASYILYQDIILRGDGGQIGASLSLPSSHPAALICVRANTPEAAAAEVRREAEAFVGRNPMTPPLEIFQADQELVAESDARAKDCLGVAQRCSHFEATRREVLAVAKCPCPNPDACGK